MLFKRIAHVCLNVESLKRSMVYYHKLGFVDRFKFVKKGADFGMYMELADKSYVEVFEVPEKGPTKNNGLAHFCLETEDMDALMAHLTAQGVAFTPNKKGADHTWQIWLEDPDGNKFEVHQYSAESMQMKGGVVEATW